MIGPPGARVRNRVELAWPLGQGCALAPPLRVVDCFATRAAGSGRRQRPATFELVKVGMLGRQSECHTGWWGGKMRAWRTKST